MRLRNPKYCVSNCNRVEFPWSSHCGGQGSVLSLYRTHHQWRGKVEIRECLNAHHGNDNTMTQRTPLKVPTISSVMHGIRFSRPHVCPYSQHTGNDTEIIEPFDTRISALQLGSTKTSRTAYLRTIATKHLEDLL